MLEMSHNLLPLPRNMYVSFPLRYYNLYGCQYTPNTNLILMQSSNFGENILRRRFNSKMIRNVYIRIYIWR